MNKREILLIGLNHKTAPVEVREKVAFSQQMLRSALTHFDTTHPRGRLEHVCEGVIISTCNRLEVYSLVTDSVLAQERIVQFLGRSTNTALSEFSESLYVKQNETAINHLLNVASGLDSMVLGEPQILGQITDAYECALSQDAVGTIMSGLFRKAIYTGKRARTETTISINPSSISSVAANLAENLLGNLSDHKILLIGSGMMAEIAVKSLVQHGVQQIIVANRTYERAAELAEKWNGKAINFQQLPEALKTADIVISSTGAPHTILSKAMLRRATAERTDRPIFLIDIAVPRDIDSDVTELPNVHLYDIDDLQQQLDDNLEERQAVIPLVTDIIDQEQNAFLGWLNSLDVVSTIVDLREDMERVRQGEMAWLGKKLDVDHETEALISAMTQRLVNKILHNPIVNLKRKAAHGDSAGYASMARDLFGLQALADTEFTDLPPMPYKNNGHKNGVCNRENNIEHKQH
ncbi:glutamyl-tRNA reductase [Anaerolineales bacterium HSG6]|nr:glutamyl-tRNA reductase [Anaerolineales bacterium HSG6]MDM8532071.1 glutamyl-tRNA reductase [Anaerolineales bacterium HSG25]